MIEYIAIVLLIIVVYWQSKQIWKLSRKINELLSKKQSLSTTYGQVFEQLIPFSKSFPYNTKDFRFIGNPIDGIVFDDNKIVFCEIKLNKSKLNSSQRKIRDLIKKKKVEWREIRGE